MAIEHEIERMVVRLMGDGAHYQRMLQQAEQSTRHFNNSVARVSEGNHFEGLIEQIRHVGNELGTLGAIASGVFYLTGKKALTSAASYESTTVAFKTFLGSAQEAEDTLAKLTDFAALTPFEMPEIEATARMMIQFGERGDDLMHTLEILGNAASATNTPFGMIATNFNQIRGIGHLVSMDFKQFAQRGVLSLQDIADHFGVTTQAAQKMLSNGEVTFEAVKAMFEKFSAAGGKFADMMIEQSKTLEGRWATFKDAMNLAWRGVGQAMMPAAKLILEIGIRLAEAFRAAPDWVKKLLAVVIGLGGALGISATALAGWMIGFQKVVSLISGVRAILSGIGTTGPAAYNATTAAVVRTTAATNAAAIATANLHAQLKALGIGGSDATSILNAASSAADLASKAGALKSAADTANAVQNMKNIGAQGVNNAPMFLGNSTSGKVVSEQGLKLLEQQGAKYAATLAKANAAANAFSLGGFLMKFVAPLKAIVTALWGFAVKAVRAFVALNPLTILLTGLAAAWLYIKGESDKIMADRDNSKDKTKEMQSDAIRKVAETKKGPERTDAFNTIQGRFETDVKEAERIMKEQDELYKKASLGTTLSPIMETVFGTPSSRTQAIQDLEEARIALSEFKEERKEFESIIDGETYDTAIVDEWKEKLKELEDANRDFGLTDIEKQRGDIQRAPIPPGLKGQMLAELDITEDKMREKEINDKIIDQQKEMERNQENHVLGLEAGLVAAQERLALIGVESEAERKKFEMQQEAARLGLLAPGSTSAAYVQSVIDQTYETNKLAEANQEAYETQKRFADEAKNLTKTLNEKFQSPENKYIDAVTRLNEIKGDLDNGVYEKAMEEYNKEFMESKKVDVAVTAHWESSSDTAEIVNRIMDYSKMFGQMETVSLPKIPETIDEKNNRIGAEMAMQQAVEQEKAALSAEMDFQQPNIYDSFSVKSEKSLDNIERGIARLVDMEEKKVNNTTETEALGL